MTETPTETGFDRMAIESALTHFVVIGLGYWGKGKTLKEAADNCRKQGCKHNMKTIAFWGDSTITVTSMGTVQADKAMLALGEV